MQWETVCSVTPDGKAKRRVTTAKRLHMDKNIAKNYKRALPRAYYGKAFDQNTTPDPANPTVGVRIQALTFGSPHDGFYAATNYVRW